MIDRYRWHFACSELAAGENSAVAGYHFEARVHQNGNIESERFDAPGNLTDLPAAVQPRIGAVENQSVDWPVNDLQLGISFRPPKRRSTSGDDQAVAASKQSFNFQISDD
jgi:hypothetical protein